MELLANLAQGFDTAFTLTNLGYCLLGVLIGTAVGVLPGFGPLPAMSVLLPFTFHLGDPVTGMIFMAGIYYGTQYGGSTTSILLKLPGEISSMVTVIDGYEMTRQGRGGAALAIAALASFFAGTVATLLIAMIGAPLADLAFLFGPAEYTSLLVLGLIGSVSLSNGAFLPGVAMVLMGMLLATVGTDLNSGVERFVFDVPDLMDGINFGIMAMGMIGLAELLYTLIHEPNHRVQVPRLRELYPNREETRRSIMPTLRGTAIGSILGLLPGGGAVLSSFASYAVEKKVSKHPQQFGKGAVEGVAGPESANNAGAQTSFVPMLSLGLPVNPVQAILLAVLVINNITPGPQVISSNGTLFWGLIASMWIGNLFLVMLNLPLVGIWTSLLKVPKKLLYPMIIVGCVIGAYSLRNNWFDVCLLIPFTLVGYVFKRLGIEVAPMAMGFVVGSLFEENFKRTMILSQGSWSVFLERPVSLGLLSLTVLVILAGIWMKTKKPQIGNTDDK